MKKQEGRMAGLFIRLEKKHLKIIKFYAKKRKMSEAAIVRDAVDAYEYHYGAK